MNKIMTMATAAARGQLLLLNISSQTTRPIMMFSAPPSSEGMTNSPRQGMKTSIEPAMMPALLSGMVISQKAFQGVKMANGYKSTNVSDVCLIVRKGDIDTLNRLNKAIATIKTDGSLAQIVKKWGI